MSVEQTNAAATSAAVVALPKGVEMASSIVMIPLTRLTPGTNYSRQFKMSDEAWKIVVEQFKPLLKAGTIDPIHVSKVSPQGKYTVIAGFQRWAAAKELGIESIPCKLTGLEPESDAAFLDNLAENEHRTDTTLVEKAYAMKAYGERFSIADWHKSTKVLKFFRMPLSTARVARQLIEKLSKNALEKMHYGELDIDGARMLAAMSEDLQDVLLKEAIIVKAEENAEAKATVAANVQARGQGEEAKAKAKVAAATAPVKQVKKVSTKHIAKAAERVAPTEAMKKMTAQSRASIKAAKEKRAAAEAAKLAKANGAGAATAGGAKPSDAAKKEAKAQEMLDKIYSWADLELAKSVSDYVQAIGKMITGLLDSEIGTDQATKDINELLAPAE